MVSRRCIEAVGPLDPYLYFYWEETDFAAGHDIKAGGLYWYRAR